MQIVIMPIRRSAAAPPKEDTPPAPAPEPGMNLTFARSRTVRSHPRKTFAVCVRTRYKIHSVVFRADPDLPGALTKFC